MKIKIKAYTSYKLIITKRTDWGVACRDIITHRSQFVQQIFEEAEGSDLTYKG